MFKSLQADLYKFSVVRVSRSQDRHTKSLVTLVSFLDDCIPRMINMEMLEQLSIEQ